MPLDLEIDSKKLSACDSPKVHYIPAKVHGDGPAKVEDYFEPYTEENEGVLKNAFRGYPLSGKEMAVPLGYKGIIFQASSTLDAAPLKLVGKFEKFVYWNYDTNPSPNDALAKVIGSLNVLKAVHEKVEKTE